MRAALPLLAGILIPGDPSSPNADDITAAVVVMLVVAVALIVAINAALVIALLRFRARRGAEPARFRSGRRVQSRVAGALGALAAGVFVVGVLFTESARTVDGPGPNGLEASLARTAQTGVDLPADAEPLEIDVIGQQWLWRFEYPGGRTGDRTFSYEELVVPVDTPVVLDITSIDVLHRWWVPDLGGKVDAVPGQHRRTWFKAEEEGVHDGRSAAYSGPGYPTMRATVRAVAPEEYQAWLDRQAADLADAQDAVQEEAERMAEEEAR